MLGEKALKRLIAFIVSLALFMDALDATILNTAIPAMSRSLLVNPVDLKIALISYLLALAIFIPISGWMGDRFGIKRIFISALAIFTISSLFCGYATNLHEIVVARFCQGLGGSLMLPLGRLIVLRTFARHELVASMNHIIMVVSFGLMLGPLAGGFITDHFSWPWIFWVNIPVGIFTILLAGFFFKDMHSKKVAPLDAVGFVLFGGGLAGLTFALSDLSETSRDVMEAITILLISLLMLLLYFVHARKQKHPVVDTKLFKIRTFRISVLGNLFARVSFGGMPFLLPLLMQVGLHFSAQLSGLLMVPIAIGVLMVKSMSLPILRYFGYKQLLIQNTVMVAISVWAFCFINPAVSPSLIALFAFIFGFIISIQYSAMNSLAYADLTADNLSAATSIVSTTQQISQSLGVALSAILLRLYSSMSGKILVLTPHIFHQAFLTLGVITLSSAIIFIRMMKPSDGQSMLKGPEENKPSVLN